MKKLHIKILLLFAFVSSCQLTDVLDQDPPNNLVPENVVKTESDAMLTIICIPNLYLGL